MAQAADSTPPPLPTARGRFWVRPLLSLAVPGAGQLAAHQDRGAVYLAVELYTLARVLQLNHDGNTAGGRFRDLAFDVARRGFTAVRRDTVFEYYEMMERFTESGEFDRDPGPALAPESDPTTFNGSVWLLARRTFWARSEEHTSELQSRLHLVCRLLLEKKKTHHHTTDQPLLRHEPHLPHT